MTEDISDQFRTKMSEWVTLKKQLGEARKDMKLLNNKEKELKTYIMSFMSDKGIDNVNLKKGKVSLRATKKKQALTKDKVESGLLKHFQGDEVKTETAMNCIIDNLEIKNSNIISLTGLNTKKDS